MTFKALRFDERTASVDLELGIVTGPHDIIKSSSSDVAIACDTPWEHLDTHSFFVIRESRRVDGMVTHKDISIIPPGEYPSSFASAAFRGNTSELHRKQRNFVAKLISKSAPLRNNQTPPTKQSNTTVEDWRRFVVSDPYGPLRATKGIDPSEFGYHSILRESIRMNLPSDQLFLPMVRETTAALSRSEYEGDIVDCIIQGVRLTDEECYAFLHLWAAYGSGLLATYRIALSAPPPDDIQTAAKIFEQSFSRIPGTTAIITPSPDGSPRGFHSVVLHDTLTLRTEIRDPRSLDSTGHESMYRTNVKALFIPGPCSALYFWECMLDHIPVLRWPGGQKRAILFVPRPDRLLKRRDALDFPTAPI